MEICWDAAELSTAESDKLPPASLRTVSFVFNSKAGKMSSVVQPINIQINASVIENFFKRDFTVIFYYFV